ncbi:MAG: hypothetical protein K0R29_1728 [Pseudobdellovibrio sp.]|nr:hypothetical protein [Pseudobdellovibrio sp.]
MIEAKVFPNNLTGFLVDQLPVGVTYVDANEKYVYCNSTFARWRGLEPQQIIGKSVRDFLDDETYYLVKKVIAATLAGEPHVSEITVHLNGKPRIIQLVSIPDIDPEGKVRGYSTTSIDITAQKESEAALYEAKLAAECANRAKSEFLANMSHEIRTPLGAVLGFADLIASSDVTEQERQTFVSAVHRNGELLTNIISDILDLSKVEVGKLHVECKDTPLNDILSDVMTLMGRKANEKGISLKLTFDGVIPKVICTDALRLRQVLLNIVGNSIKFTQKGSVELNIKLCESGQNPVLSFAVKDTGKGISKEEAARLFNPFSQADGSIVRKFGGTGLGLVLSRHLSRLLGGDLVLTESEPEKGSTFTVSIDPGKVAFEENSESLVSERKASVSVTTIRLDGHKILIVDDSVDNQLFISKVLKIAGAEVDIADNGQMAIDRMMKKKYSICLMDIQMPVMDGYEAAGEMRKLGCQFPIVALTAHAFKDVRQHCIQSGFNDYLSKPINRNDLIERISRIISSVSN